MDLIPKIKNSTPTITSGVGRYIAEYVSDSGYGLAHSSLLSLDFVAELCEYFINGHATITIDGEEVLSPQPVHVLHEAIDTIEFWGLLYLNGLIVVRQVNDATPSMALMLFAPKDLFESIGLVVKQFEEVFNG